AGVAGSRTVRTPYRQARPVPRPSVAQPGPRATDGLDGAQPRTARALIGDRGGVAPPVGQVGLVEGVPLARFPPRRRRCARGRHSSWGLRTDVSETAAGWGAAR